MTATDHRRGVNLQSAALDALVAALDTVRRTEVASGEMTAARFVITDDGNVLWAADYTTTLGTTVDAQARTQAQTLVEARRRWLLLDAWCKTFAVEKRSTWGAQGPFDAPHQEWKPTPLVTAVTADDGSEL